MEAGRGSQYPQKHGSHLRSFTSLFQMTLLGSANHNIMLRPCLAFEAVEPTCTVSWLAPTGHDIFCDWQRTCHQRDGTSNDLYAFGLRARAVGLRADHGFQVAVQDLAAGCH